jgi:hypothetical protein
MRPEEYYFFPSEGERRRVVAALVYATAMLACVGMLAGRGSLDAGAAEARVEPREDAGKFAAEILHNEVKAQLEDTSLWSYREVKVENGKRKLFYVCQTSAGQIERLAAINDEPLTESQARAEDARIRKLLTHPDEIREQQRKEQKDGEQARSLLKMFPEAFLFEYAGQQGSLVSLSFKPNPKFRPSGRPEQVFHHLEGMLWLDGERKRLAAIDGRLTSEVKFGGGLLGHLDNGGTFTVRQQEMATGQWEISAMRVQMRGKALFFKTISVQQDETYADFKPVSEGTNLTEAAKQVNKEAREFKAPVSQDTRAANSMN